MVKALRVQHAECPSRQVTMSALGTAGPSPTVSLTLPERNFL